MSKTVDFSAYTRPSTVGAGTWYFLHLKGEHLESVDDIKSLYRDIQLLLKYFYCDKCRKHFNQFAEENDFEKAMKDDIKDFNKGVKPEHLAKLLVKAHNGATKHKFIDIGKKSGRTFTPVNVDYSSVKTFFHSKDEAEFEPCTENCDSEDEDEEKPVTKSYSNYSIVNSSSSSSSSKPKHEISSFEKSSSEVYKTQGGGSIRVSPRASSPKIKSVNTNKPQFSLKIVPSKK